MGRSGFVSQGRALAHDPVNETELRPWHSGDLRFVSHIRTDYANLFRYYYRFVEGCREGLRRGESPQRRGARTKVKEAMR